MSLALLWVKGMCPDRISAAQGAAGQHPEPLLAGDGEPAVADPSPPAGHSPDQFGTLDRQHQSDAMRRMKTLLYG